MPDPALNPRRSLVRQPQDVADRGRPALVGCVPPRELDELAAHPAERGEPQDDEEHERP
jgi:hypothetical protein